MSEVYNFGVNTTIPRNFDKEFDILLQFGVGYPPTTNSARWNKGDPYNWRNYMAKKRGGYDETTNPPNLGWEKKIKLPNGTIDEHPLTVSPAVSLFSDNTQIDFEYKHETEDAMESVIQRGAGGLVQKTAQFLDAARSAYVVLGTSPNTGGIGDDPGMFKSIYTSLPAWTKTTPLLIPSSIKITFHFGQAGLFDGWQEVVKPVLCLAAINSLQVPKHGPKNTYSGPVPSVSLLITQFIAEFAKESVPAAKAAYDKLSKRDDTDPNAGVDSSSMNSILGGSNIDLTSGDVLGTAISLANSIQSTAVTIYNNSAGEALKTARLFNFRRGKMMWGPCLVKGVKWGFDFTDVDVNGCPTVGWVELNDIQNIKMALVQDIINIYPVSSSGSSASDDPNAKLVV